MISRLLFLLALQWISCFSYSSENELKIGDQVSLEKIRSVRSQTVDTLTKATCDGVKAEATIKYPDFNKYYKLAESSREGKALEACLAHSHNFATTDTTLVPSAMIEKGNGSFHVHHPADLIEVDQNGIIKRFIQSKRTLQPADLVNPRYKGMSFMTSKESLDRINQELSNTMQKCLRRGIPVSGDAAIYDEAIKSGRIIMAMPDGSPLPTLETISRVARADTLLKYNNSKALIKNPLLMLGNQANSDIDKIASDFLRKNPGARTEVLNGILAKNGKILTACKIGSQAALVTFAVDGGVACYRYNKGDINLPDLQKEIADAAVKSSAVGAATAVTMIIASTPSGLILVAVSAGAYIIADIGLKKYHEISDAGLLKPGDLEAFGFKDAHNYSLNLSAWPRDHKESLSPSEWSEHR